MNNTDRRILGLLIVMTFVALSLTILRKNSIHAGRITQPTLINASAKTVLGETQSYEGNATAPYTLVEFADYQCPFCFRTNDAVNQMIARNRNRLKLAFHHFPLPMHPRAAPSALAAEVARTRGRFWTMHTLLMRQQGKLEEKDLAECARLAGVALADADTNTTNRARMAVQRDLNIAQTLGVNGTPSFFLCMPDGSVIKLGSFSQAENVIGKSL